MCCEFGSRSAGRGGPLRRSGTWWCGGRSREVEQSLVSSSGVSTAGSGILGPNDSPAGIDWVEAWFMLLVAGVRLRVTLYQRVMLVSSIMS